MVMSAIRGEFDTGNRELFFTIAFAISAGFVALFVMPVDNFWIFFVCSVFSFVVLCKFKIGFYLLVPLVMFELQSFMIHTSKSLRTDFVGIYFPVLILTFTGWILTRFAGLPGGYKKNIPNIDFYISLLLAWSALTLLWVPNFQHALIQWVRFVGNIFILYLVANTVTGVRGHKWIVFILLIVGIALSVGAILSITLYRTHGYSYMTRITDLISLKFSFVVFPYPYHPRAMGLLPHNAVAGLLNTITGLTLILFLFEKKIIYKSILLVSMIFMAYAILQTKSRGGLVAYLVMWGFFFITLPPLKDKFIRNALFFIIVFTAVFMSVYWEHLFTSRLSSGSAGHSVTQRLEWWADGLKVLHEQYSWMGMGPGGFKYHQNPWIVPHAHNIYLSVLFDYGIIGFATFIALIFFLGKHLYGILKSYVPTYTQSMVIGSLGGIVALGIHGLIDIEYNIAPLWFLLGLLVATSRMAREELNYFQANKERSV